VVVAEQLLQRRDGEQQARLADLGLLDDHLLPYGFLLEGPEQRLRGDGAALPLARAGAGLLPAGAAALDEAAGPQQRPAPQVVALVRLLECPLDLLVVGGGDGDRHAHGQVPLLDGLQEPLLAAGQQLEDAADVGHVEVGLAGDLGVAVTPLLERPDLPHQLHRGVLPAGQVLGQAHQQQVFLRALHDDGRDLLLAQREVGLQAPLAADQVVARLAVLHICRGYRHRLLEPQPGDVGHDLGELLLAPLPGVQDVDLPDRDHAHCAVVAYAHAASSMLRRAASAAK
jgi:hypothetical protein